MPTNINELNGAYVEENKGTINQTFNFDGRIFTEPKVTHNFPSSNLKIYGRDNEAELLRQTLCGNTPASQTKRFAIISAPSGFGKSMLLEKALHTVAAIDAIKPEYQGNVQQILLIDCRLKKSLSDIVGDFNDLLGTQEIYQDAMDADAFSQQLVQLPKNKVWLILDNFEQWLDDSYNLINPQVRSFLNALFNYNPNLRGVLLSQSPPNGLQNQLNTLSEIGTELFNGLPEERAIEMLRESKVGGLHFADESILKVFLDKVFHIPQAIAALIGYLNSREGYTFIEFMNDQDFWNEFDLEEQDITAVERGERHTKALIARQIYAQSSEVKLLLQALTFFGREVSKIALEALFENKAIASSHISRLTSHNLATKSHDLRGSSYYNLHSYFREQALRVFPELGEIIASEPYAKDLLRKGIEQYSHHFLSNAINLYECSEKIYKLRNHNDKLAVTYLNKGAALCVIGKLNDGVIEFEKAIVIQEELVKQGRGELANELAATYLNKGNAQGGLGKLNEAIIEYNKAIATLKKLVEQGRVELANELASAHMNKGVALVGLGKLNEAIIEYDEVILIREELGKQGRSDLAKKLAMAYMNIGVALKGLGKPKEAIIEYDKAIVIQEDLVGKGRSELANELAKSYMNKGVALGDLGELNEAIIEYDKVIAILEPLMKQGRSELANDLARTYMNKGIVLQGFVKLKEAIIEYNKAIVIQEGLMEQGRGELANDLAKSYMNKGVALGGLGELDEAIIEYDKAIVIREGLMEQGRTEIANELAMTYMNKGVALGGLGELDEAIIEYDKAIAIREELLVQNQG